MTPSQLSQLIGKEINGEWSRTNLHGIDLKTCLVTPKKFACEDSFAPETLIELWLVLEEFPDNKSGSKIVFEEELHVFGLAIPASKNEAGVFIGYYGTFLETLAGM